MGSIKTYKIYGPTDSLKRLSAALIEEIKPEYSYLTELSESRSVHVVLYEEYLKQINSSVSLTSVFELKSRQLHIELASSGGRMGFRGSSLDIEQTIKDKVSSFILEYVKRYGLSVQESNKQTSR